MIFDQAVNVPVILLIIFLSLGFLALNIILGSSVAIGFSIMMLATRKVAKKLFFEQWVRRDKQQFERKCSNENLDYHLDMYNQGLAYRDSKKKYIKKVHVVNDNLDLYGEFYDFNNKQTVIIIPGRSEACYYGAYYAEVFENNGYNVLCFDPRGHGISSGKYFTLGIKENEDVITWARLLHDEYGQEHIILYGICGGATCACFTFLNEKCQHYINGFIADGMFYSFFETYREHIKERKKPVYPVIWHFFSYFKKIAKVDPYSAAPYKMINKIDVPLLIISGEKDVFALPKYAKKLYEKSISKDKYLSIIKNARHSHVRYDNKYEYDYVVSNFLKKYSI